MTAYHLAVASLLGLVLLQLIFNLRVLRRLSTFERGEPHYQPASISVLVPARNEGVRVEACVRAWLAQRLPPTELILLDDESTDETAAAARRAMVGVIWARVVRGIPKPPGWSGKSFACYQLAQMACGDMLVFADADVLVAPGVLAALKAVFADPCIDAVTVLPRHTASSWVGRHVLPLQSWVLACFYPLWLTVRWPSALLAAANGQLLAVRRRAYEAIGTHRAVWQSLAEDVELGRRLTGAGFRLQVVDGTNLVRCSAYETLPQVWRGHARNLFAILFRSDALATAVILGLLVGWGLPWVWLGLAIAESGQALTLTGLQLACGLATRLLVARRFGYPLKDTWSHPLLVVLLVALVGYSLWAYRHGRIRWRGREYVPQEPRSCTNGPSPEDV